MLTFVTKAKKVDKWAVCWTERGLILLRWQWLKMSQVGRTHGQGDGGLCGPLHWGWGRLIISSHDTAGPATIKTNCKWCEEHVMRTSDQIVTGVLITPYPLFYNEAVTANLKSVYPVNKWAIDKQSVNTQTHTVYILDSPLSKCKMGRQQTGSHFQVTENWWQNSNLFG